MMNENERASYNRVVWHSRRGMLELDLVLEPYVKFVYLTLDLAGQAMYRKLLECEDQDLFDWFMGKKVVPEEDLANVVGVILDYKKSRRDDG